jgi:curved DNA-binding protein CbpA
MAIAGDNHYETLGIGQHASADAVKQRFRELARQWHPDVARVAGAAERFKAINEAYRVLSDPERRAQYDAELRLRGRGGSTAPPWDSATKHTGSTTPPSSRGSHDTRAAQPGGARKAAAADASRSYAVGRLLHDAEAAMAGMRLHEASRFCRAALELDRRNPLAHEILGDISRVRGRMDEALAHYTVAIQMDTGNLRLRAKFERVAFEGVGHRGGSAPARGGGARQAVVLMLGVALIAVLVAIVASLADSGVDGAWSPWEWSPAVILGLPICGGVAGLVGSVSGYLRPARFELILPASGPKPRVAAPMGVVLVMMSLVCFWLAGGVYVAKAGTQDAGSRSIVSAFGVSAVVVSLFAATTPGLWAPILLLGGNLVFPAFVGGWILGDGGRA